MAFESAVLDIRRAPANHADRSRNAGDGFFSPVLPEAFFFLRVYYFSRSSRSAFGIFFVWMALRSTRNIKDTRAAPQACQQAKAALSSQTLTNADSIDTVSNRMLALASTCWYRMLAVTDRYYHNVTKFNMKIEITRNRSINCMLYEL